MKKIFSLEEIQNVAEVFVNELQGASRGKDSAVVFGLSGNLGTGKTTFMQSVANVLGSLENVVSPTFVLRRDYDISYGSFKKLIHIDVYRLEKPDMIMQVLTDVEIANSSNFIAIEWPEKVDEKLFDKIFYFTHEGENERGIEF